jgi:hypothetical protein
MGELETSLAPRWRLEIAAVDCTADGPAERPFYRPLPDVFLSAMPAVASGHGQKLRIVATQRSSM